MNLLKGLLSLALICAAHLVVAQTGDVPKNTPIEPVVGAKVPKPPERIESVNIATKKLSPERLKSFYACLVTISPTEIVMVKFSPHRISGSKETFSCDQFDETSITEILMNVYASIFGKYFVDVSYNNSENKDGIHYTYACRESGLKGIFSKTCPSDLVRAVNNDKADFQAQMNAGMAMSQRRKFGSTDEFSDFKAKALIDPVAQILNKSSGCEEFGCRDSFWYAENTVNCVYRKASFNNLIFSPSISEIHLFEINPKELKIANDTLKIGNQTLPVTTVKFNKKTLFLAMDQLDVEQLTKDWAMIYAKYCPVPAAPGSK
jgi:hypothetical protein